jgi:hypothetical protein
MPTAMGKRKPPSEQRKGDRHTSPRQGFYLSQELVDALDAAVKASRPRTAIVTVAIEEYLAGLGFWPWPRTEPPPPGRPTEED